MSLGLGIPEAKADNDVGQFSNWDERPDDEIYVFGLELDGYILSEGFILFYDGKEAFLPLGALADALEFPIEINTGEGIAQGWFLNDDRTFDLNLKAGNVKLKKRSLPIEPGQVERHPDDLYISFSELEKWFPFVLELRFEDLQIGVRALEPFPLQERIAKEARRSQIKHGESEEGLELIVPENDWFELPFLDISIDASGRNTENSIEGQVRQTTTVVGIVGGLDSEATLVANSAEEFPNIRLHMGRQSLDGGLLGPLDAREFSLGDVTTPDLALIADNTVGRGFSVSSFDLNRLEQTNKVTLRGELAVGWEVEIYRNGELIDFQTDTDVGDGRYEFTNVATVSGLNEFRLVFYGPQGQRREKFERYFVTAELAESQKGSFRIAANQTNRDLISFQKQINPREDDGENRIVAQAEYGITDVLSINGGVASLSYDGTRRNYAKVGAQTTFLGALGNMDIAVDDAGRTAVGARAQTQLGSWSLAVEQNWFQNFHSEQSDNSSVDGHLRSKTIARVNGHIPDYGLGNQPFTASVAHEISEDKERETQIFGRVSSVVRPFNLALSSTARIRSDQKSDSDARMLISTLMGDFRLRGEVGYKITPVAELDKVSLSADWRINEDFGTRFGLSHSGGNQSLNVASAGLNHQFDNFALGVNLEADSDGNYNARMGLSFSLGHDPNTGGVEMKSQAFARRSAISAQVFLDKDNDGVYGPDDSLIENAGFSGGALSRDIKTSADGTAFIVGLEPYREIEIGLNNGTLVDPFWVSATKNRKLILRPGTTTTLQFPVIETGEVDGLVILEDISLTTNGAVEITEKNSAGLRVILLDSNGRKISETMSAYDGYFFFNHIPYGEYKITLDTAQLTEAGYKSQVGSKSFVIDQAEPFISAQDLFIQTGDKI
ncbi:hypothetical protein [Kiloniella sp. EL199]|uniref:hypothetical protein n=1 Tax=Kiloniella sp. EL199 TaxID=2107581 RepID=UPI0013C49307|nr:hypothetical protein [Kiloniella sp. EL199]